MVVNYRMLIIIANGFPLPKWNEVLQPLPESQWLTMLDAPMGFFQLGAKPSSHGGLSQFARTPFGNLRSPSNFQQLLWNILVLFLWIFAFNTVIYFLIFRNHLDHLCQVLGAIERPGVTLATSKHLFEYQSFLPSRKEH
jgi:hypothetical protein